MEDEYDKLTQKFIEDMRAVRAPVEDYLVSLRAAIGEIETAIDAGEKDINKLEGEAI